MPKKVYRLGLHNNEGEWQTIATVIAEDSEEALSLVEDVSIFGCDGWEWRIWGEMDIESRVYHYEVKRV